MTDLRTNPTGPKPTWNVPHVSGLETVIAACPKGSVLSIQDRFLSCVQVTASASDTSVQAAMKTAASRLQWGSRHLAEAELKSFVQQNGANLSAEDFLRLATFALTRFNNESLETNVMDVLTRQAAKHGSFQTLLRMAELAEELGSSYDVERTLVTALGSATNSEDLATLSRYAKSVGLIGLSQDAEERAAKLKRKGQ